MPSEDQYRAAARELLRRMEAPGGMDGDIPEIRVEQHGSVLHVPSGAFVSLFVFVPVADAEKVKDEKP